MKSSFRNILLAMAAVSASAVLIYQNSVSSELLWDDAAFVENNHFLNNCSNLKTALNPAYFFKPLNVPMRGRPALNVSILLDTCRGARAAGMRRTNIMLHAANAALVFAAAYSFTGALVPAFIAGAIFALHPLAAEPVSIITFRSQLLCAFFYLCALLSALTYLRRKHAAFLFFTILFFFAAMFSNEAGITFPLALALFFLTVERPADSRRQLALLFCICAAAAAAYIWFRLPRGGYALPGTGKFGTPGFLDFLYPETQAGAAPPAGAADLTKLTYTIHIRLPGPENPLSLHPAAPPWNEIYVSWKLRILTMTGILGGYFKTLLLPLNLKLDYNPPLIRGFLAAVPGFLIIAGAALAAWLLRHKKPLTAFGISFIFVSLLPVMNLVPIYNIKADRYLYIALIGYALAAAGLAASADGGYKRPLAVIMLCYALALGAGTYIRNPELRDNFHVFSAIAGGAPEVPRAEINMAREYAKRKDPSGVMRHLRRSLAVQENAGVRSLLERIEKTGRIPEGVITQ